MKLIAPDGLTGVRPVVRWLASTGLQRFHFNWGLLGAELRSVKRAVSVGVFRRIVMRKIDCVEEIQEKPRILGRRKSVKNRVREGSCFTVSSRQRRQEIKTGYQTSEHSV